MLNRLSPARTRRVGVNSTIQARERGRLSYALRHVRGHRLDHVDKPAWFPAVGFLILAAKVCRAGIHHRPLTFGQARADEHPHFRVLPGPGKLCAVRPAVGLLQFSQFSHLCGKSHEEILYMITPLPGGSIWHFLITFHSRCRGCCSCRERTKRTPPRLVIIAAWLLFSLYSDL